MTHRLLKFFAFLALAFAAPAQADTALEVELDKAQLVRLGADAASVFVANPDVADVQMLAPDTVTIFGKRTGETTLIVMDGQRRTLFNRRVVVNQNLSALKDSLDMLVPNGEISVQSVPGGIVLLGNVASAAEAEDARRLAVRFIPQGGEVINRINVTGANQVMLKVRIAEMQRTVNKQFGMNWDVFNSGSQGFGFGRGRNFINPDNRYALVDPFSFLPLGDIERSGGADTLVGRLVSGQWEVTALLDALEDEGLVSILAEPSLTAMSGETANFLAGGEFPIPVPQGDGTISITYREYGVSLAFTPTLVDGDKLNLRVRPEVSQISAANSVTQNGFNIPSLITRRAETTVELASGQSFVVAGLLQNNTNQDANKLPGLGDLPVLGALFRSQAFTRDETELVIIVTPYIVKPSDEPLSAPTDGFAVPDDASRIFLDRRMEQVPVSPTAELVDDEPLNFVVE